MKYLSVCSGIEAASVAWEPLGWEPVAFAEIEAFPSAVLAHHFPDVPNLGDMTKHETWNLKPGSIDLLVGGTPCQSFSVAGLRQGLHDPRGGLMLTYIEIAQRLRPRWVCWENVPGVLSSSGGRDFGSFLGALGDLGYGWAYRVLDAQYVRTHRHPRAVPQRRRRVFVVGCFGDWKRAAEVLLESESVRGNTSARGKARQGATADVAGSPGAASGGSRCRLDGNGAYIPEVVQTVSAKWAKGTGGPSGDEAYNLVAPCVAFASNLGTRGGDVYDDGSSPTVRVGSGPSPPAVAFDARQSDVLEYGPISGPLDTDGHSVGVVTMVNMQGSKSKACTATDGSSYTINAMHGQHAVHAISACLTSSNDPSRSPQSAEVTNQVAAVYAASATVRRLTPRECERLQGFQDDWTAIPWRGKPASDGPRYRAIGNSMAVNCMEWIGQRIAGVDARISA